METIISNDELIQSQTLQEDNMDISEPSSIPKFKALKPNELLVN